ncbi:MAG: carbohydrate-binding domain-containing protein [Bacteroidales bacterium]|nr:carbohydrate-binding domain-containing protein [Bacteroidales bacterium]
MRKIFLTTALVLSSALSAFAQTIYICKDGDYTEASVTDGLEISLSEDIDSITFSKPQMEKVVNIVYDGAQAKVTIPSFVQGVSCSSGTSSDVVLTSTNITDEIIYNVVGSSSDGSLVIEGDYKLTIRLNGVDLTSKKGAAIHVKCGKRIAVDMADGTVNSFADAANGTQKACIYTKGHFEFEGAGTLNVTGNANHAIASKEYLQIKKSVKAINILKAANDAIHAGQYFQMNGGELNITKTTVSDGIQAEYELDDNDAIIQDEENTGGVVIKGGTLNITMENSEDAKAIKAEGDIDISGGTFVINAVSNGTRGIQTDGDLIISEDNNPTSITINAKGAKCTLAEDVDDPHRCMGMKIDGNMTVNAGTINVYNTGSKSKGIKVVGVYTVKGGTVNASIDND